MEELGGLQSPTERLRHCPGRFLLLGLRNYLNPRLAHTMPSPRVLDNIHNLPVTLGDQGLQPEALPSTMPDQG